MDKSKVKYILIIVVVVLAIVILYRYFSGMAENAVEEEKQKGAADAQLYAKQQQDVYTDSREEVGRQLASQNTSAMEETVKAETGAQTLEEYVGTLHSSVKSRYLSMRDNYIRVMGVDPGVIRYDALSDWYAQYNSWRGANDQYIQLTGESLSFLDPNTDTAEEVNAAIVTAKANIEEARRQLEMLWNKEYALFNNDRETDDGLAFKGVDFIPLNMLKKWLDNPMQLASLQDYLTGMYNLFVSSDLVKIKGVFNQQKSFWTDEGYIDWNRSKSDTNGARLMDGSFWQAIKDLGNNGILLLNDMIAQTGGWAIFYKPDASGDTTDRFRTVCADIASMCECAASFEQNIRSDRQRDAHIVNQYRAWAAELKAISGTPTYFGIRVEDAETMLSKYSQELYGLSDDQVKQIMNNKKTLSSFLQDVES